MNNQNNPRGTYLPKNKPNSHLTSAHRVDRTTHNTSLPKQSDKEQADRAITKILEVISKLENPTNTLGISRETLKAGGNKIFFDVYCIFLRAMDGSTDRAEFSSSNSVDFLIESLKFFGYPKAVSKSLFQPIGAPHTWPACLQILEWLAQLGAFAYNFQAAMEERVFEEDVNSLILKTFSSKNDEPVASFIAARIDDLQNQNANNLYAIESKEMAIRNQHAAQKDLSLLSKEYEREKEIAYRMRQEHASIQADVKIVEENIRTKHEQLLQAQDKLSAGVQTLQKIRYEILHQEMLPDQLEKVKVEIRDTRHKISEMEQGIAQTITLQKSVNQTYIEDFTDCASNTRKMTQKIAALTIAKHQDKPVVPILNPLDLSQQLRKTMQDETLDLEAEERLAATFKEKEFLQYFRRQEDMRRQVQTVLLRQEQGLMGQEQSVQQMQSRQKWYENAIDQQTHNKKNLQTKTLQRQAEIANLQRLINKLEKDSKHLDEEILRKTAQQDLSKEQLRQALTELKEMDEAVKNNEKWYKERLAEERTKLEEVKRFSLQKLQQYKKQLNHVFNSFQTNP